jgi:hypothetical protein
VSNHWNIIFCQEYGVAIENTDDRISRWLDEIPIQGGFQNFYQETIDEIGETTFNPGANSAYSLTNTEKEKELNCDGKAFLAAAVGELHYGKDIEIIVDYPVDTRPFNEEQKLVSHHTVIEDGQENCYGERVENFPGHETIEDQISGEEIASMYMLNMAKDAKASGLENRAEELFDEADKLRSNSSYIGRRLQDWR